MSLPDVRAYGSTVATRPRAGSRLPVHADPHCSATCPTRQTLGRLADRWTALLLEQLADGPRRFGELRSRAPGISEKMLTQTLRSLERDGLVGREPVDYTPPGVAYHLTELGRSLLEPLNAVRAWGLRHIDEVERARNAFDAETAPHPTNT